MSKYIEEFSSVIDLYGYLLSEMIGRNRIPECQSYWRGFSDDTPLSVPTNLCQCLGFNIYYNGIVLCPFDRTSVELKFYRL